MSSQGSGGALCWSRRSAFAWSKPVHPPWFTPSIKSKPPCEQHTYLQQRFATEIGVDSAQLREELIDGKSRRSLRWWLKACALCPLVLCRVHVPRSTKHCASCPTARLCLESKPCALCPKVTYTIEPVMSWQTKLNYITGYVKDRMVAQVTINLYIKKLLILFDHNRLCRQLWVLILALNNRLCPLRT